MNYLKYLLPCLFGFGVVHPCPGQTAISVAEHGHLIWAIAQGERLEISQDFRVRLDDRKLRVSLVNRGVISADASEELVVVLIQPAREPQKVTTKGDQPIVFEDVRPGISSLLVMGMEGAARAGSATYAALAFFAEAADAGVQPAAVIGPQALEVPIAVVNTDELRRELPEVTTSLNLADVSQLEDYDLQPRSHFRVRRSGRGSLVGKLHVPENQFAFSPGQNRVTIFRNNQVVAEVTSQPDGKFEIPRIDLGFYSLFVVGPYGHAAYSFEVVEMAQGAGVVPSRNTQWRLVNLQAASPAQLDVLLIPPSLMEPVVQLVTEQYGPPPAEEDDSLAGLVPAGANGASNNANAASAASAASAQGGGGAGGGAGGAGSSAGAGALAALAGVAVGFGVSADNDDGFNANVATQIAPTNPSP